MRVVVVGGGFGGLASALRLAKTGHEVTLLEATERLGGALAPIERDGFSWDAGPSHTTLPAVLRDLFRKTGRPLERELDLVPVPARRHRFEDGVVLDLPGGTRAGQRSALAEALGEAAADQWLDRLAGFAPAWEALRLDLFERAWSPEHAGREARDLLDSRLSLHKSVKRSLSDQRLRRLATWQAVLAGHQPRDVPAWAGVWDHVEQNFGLWTVAGGLHALGRVLADRLDTRGVRVLTGVTAADLAVGHGRVSGVRTVQGPVDADAVVVAIDPRRLPALASYVEQTMPAIPPVVCHLGLVGEVPELPHEVVLHGDPMLVLRTDGTAPAGARAWTLLGRGKMAEDVVTALHRAGIRVRDQLEVRIDRSPRELVEQWHGSPNGVLWQGRRTIERQLGPDTPIPGVLLAGAHARTGAGLPAVGLSAALVAQAIGPA